ncbi:MAG: hypothetical protein Q8O38_10065 [Sulfurimicrobium sp.]|nr:hypothetical protein [Sulfurimicrobium sp.]
MARHLDKAGDTIQKWQCALFLASVSAPISENADFVCRQKSFGDGFSQQDILHRNTGVISGITFDPASVSVEEIRKDAGYAGARVLITGEIAKARCKTQIDIGFGDAVTPGPVHAVYPVLIASLTSQRLARLLWLNPDYPLGPKHRCRSAAPGANRGEGAAPTCACIPMDNPG